MGATTLLAPHYVDEEEVSNIAKFIAGLDDTIPYNLLIFTHAS
jgi:pyruvate-formate lyase-activating enzyme